MLSRCCEGAAKSAVIIGESVIEESPEEIPTGDPALLSFSRLGGLQHVWAIPGQRLGCWFCEADGRKICQLGQDC